MIKVLGENIVLRVALELIIKIIEVLVDSVSEALIVDVDAVTLGDVIKGVVMATVYEVVVVSWSHCNTIVRLCSLGICLFFYNLWWEHATLNIFISLQSPSNTEDD